MIIAEEVEVGIRGQTITIRGTVAPREGQTYERSEELTLSLPLARKLLTLLTALLPLAEQSAAGPAAEVVPLSGDAA